MTARALLCVICWLRGPLLVTLAVPAVTFAPLGRLPANICVAQADATSAQTIRIRGTISTRPVYSWTLRRPTFFKT